MKKLKVLGNILFWATLISPIVAFALASEIGESDIFSTMGIVRYIWIMWLFIPIAVLSILIGIKLKKNDQKYKKNFVIAFICIFFLVIWGSFGSIFSETISFDVSKVSAIEEEINLELPDSVKVATQYFDSGSETYIKIIDTESKKKFEAEIENNQLWQKKLNPAIKSLIPTYMQNEVSLSFDVFVFYNVTSDEYNVYPSTEKYKSIFIAYDYEMQRILVLENDLTNTKLSPTKEPEYFGLFSLS